MRIKPNKPDVTSQARGRCLAGQPCPKSGYWFTQAKSDSRAYFKQDDIMPDYPNNPFNSSTKNIRHMASLE
ncbi:hypothetical protein [Psychrobacter sp. K31L]|uniref:hypothetical protein n=1 Tax=Psychrobacter sp. K31L TaxID=2820758 RepID=UPI001B31D743|nr:hypothetical protein [Psychrobacter sp. K31L]MBP3945223.1 hypothetical protein [Psychrobacter sp. K31L]